MCSHVSYGGVQIKTAYSSFGTGSFFSWAATDGPPVKNPNTARTHALTIVATRCSMGISCDCRRTPKLTCGPLDFKLSDRPQMARHVQRLVRTVFLSPGPSA